MNAELVIRTTQVRGARSTRMATTDKQGAFSPTPSSTTAPTKPSVGPSALHRVAFHLHPLEKRRHTTPNEFLWHGLMLPIIQHSEFEVPPKVRSVAARYAEQLTATGRFRGDQQFIRHTVKGLDDAPSLILDDFTDITLFPMDSLFLEQRGRLRARQGDLYVTSTPGDHDFDDYIVRQLRLGKVDWRWPRNQPASHQTARTCWVDRGLRRALVRAIRSDGLQYIHPHMGNSNVWRLAQLLSQASHRPVQVISPPPAVAHWANDKVAFAHLVSDLLGHQLVPRTTAAYSFTLLSQQVRELADHHPRLGLKTPHAAGGLGNILLDTGPIRGLPLREIDDHLRRLIKPNQWPPGTPMLVDVWENNVLESASVQTWIPPLATADPVLEGIFSQMTVGNAGHFVGCVPLQLPDHVESQVNSATSVISLLFQQLGFVGRCSFDFLLIGDDLENAKPEFIECNARWGGTSIPMTLVNDLFGDYCNQPFAAIATDNAFPRDTTFRQVCEALEDVIFRKKIDGSCTGWLIPFNPGRLQQHYGLNWIVFGETMEQVQHRIRHQLPNFLASLGHRFGTGNPYREIPTGSTHVNQESYYGNDS